TIWPKATRAPEKCWLSPRTTTKSSACAIGSSPLKISSSGKWSVCLRLTPLASAALLHIDAAARALPMPVYPNQGRRGSTICTAPWGSIFIPFLGCWRLLIIHCQKLLFHHKLLSNYPEASKNTHIENVRIPPIL